MPWTQTQWGNTVIEIPADCDSADYHQGYTCYQGRAQLIFEKTDPWDGPLETVIQAARLTFSQGLFTWDPIKAEGYEEMYAALKQLGAQGYSLSAIIEDPSLSLNLNAGMGFVTAGPRLLRASNVRGVKCYFELVGLEECSYISLDVGFREDCVD